jgi:hypothetical protein
MIHQPEKFGHFGILIPILAIIPVTSPQGLTPFRLHDTPPGESEGHIRTKYPAHPSPVDHPRQSSTNDVQNSRNCLRIRLFQCTLYPQMYLLNVLSLMMSYEKSENQPMDFGIPHFQTKPYGGFLKWWL